MTTPLGTLDVTGRGTRRVTVSRRTRETEIDITLDLDGSGRADVSTENVLRVLNGEPVSAGVSESVWRAIDELGEPPWPGQALDRPLEATIDEARRDLMKTVSRTAAELEARLPEGVGSIVYEAVRVEVRPVTQHMAQMQSLVDRLCETLERVGASVDSERQERLDDLALLTELIVTGWRTMERRVAHVERLLERQSNGYRNGNGNGNGNAERVVRHITVSPPKQ